MREKNRQKCRDKRRGKGFREEGVLGDERIRESLFDLREKELSAREG